MDCPYLFARETNVTQDLILEATFELVPSPTPTSTVTPTPIPDFDADGLLDSLEARAPAVGQTDPYLSDSDGDGLSDGIEDANRNGLHRELLEADPRDRDTDGDAFEDGIEVHLTLSNPLQGDDPVGPYLDNDDDSLPAGLDPADSDPETDDDRFVDGHEAVSGGMNSLSDESIRLGLGDVDTNGSWDNADSQGILNFFGSQPTPGTDPTRADLDRNGFIDNGDSRRSLNFFGKVNQYLPAG